MHLARTKIHMTNVTSTFNIAIIPNKKLEKIVDILGKETKPKTNTPLVHCSQQGQAHLRRK